MKEITLTQLATIMVSLTEALDRNTNALLSQQGQTTKPETPAEVKAKESEEKAAELPAETPAEDVSEISIDVVQAALLDVKVKHGADAAKAIIKEIANVATVKRIPEDKYQAVIDACAAKMEEDVVEEKEEEEEEEAVTPKHSLDDVKAAAKELGALGRTWLERAKQIIAEVGGATKTANVPVENYDKLYEALTSAKAIADAEADSDL